MSELTLKLLRMRVSCFFIGPNGQKNDGSNTELAFFAGKMLAIKSDLKTTLKWSVKL